MPKYIWTIKLAFSGLYASITFTNEVIYLPMSCIRVVLYLSLLSWFGLAVVPGVFAFHTLAGDEGLQTIDKRSAVSPEVSIAKKAAVAKLKQSIPGARVTFSGKLGSPSWVVSAKSFLTGPGGVSKAAAAGGVNALPENTPHRPVKAFLNEHSVLYGYGSTVLEEAKIKRSFATAHNGVETTVWEQQMGGIAVYESVLIGHVTANQELINLSSTFIPDPKKAALLGNPGGNLGVPWVTVEEAISIGADALGVLVYLDEVMALDDPQGAEKLQHLAGGILPGYATARLTWFPLTADRLVLAWQLELTQPLPNERYRVIIDARSGELLLRRKLTLHLSDAQYRIYTGESPAPLRPGHSEPSTNQPPFVPRALVSLEALSTNASPLGWLNDHANETRGNNVDAHLDRNADDLPDLPRPVGNPARIFDFSMDPAQGPDRYQEASVVQLFYWCNWMHDQLYELGFTEAAGNFQKDNLGRGGQDNDPLLADAQDGSGVNNANFTPTDDGESPRIQMYIFDGSSPQRDGSFDAEIVLHEYTHGLSTRLVGGGAGISLLQPSGMGEGWSDFYALSLLTQPGEDPDAVYPMSGYATYRLGGLLENYYYGIRRYPYTTDMSKNPLTLKDIDPNQIDPHTGVPLSPIQPFSPFFANEVHYQGEVWCVTLWEARANLAHKYGLEKGSRMMLQLVTDGMKLSPPNPTFLEARDAIIQADLLNNSGANWIELWSAFAKRGMGFSASVPGADSTSGVQEAFDLPDAMLVLQQRNFFPSGPAGGPFGPACMTYVLTNTSTNTIIWSSANSETWLKLEPAGGPLAPRSAVLVSVCLTPEAATLPVGVYGDTFEFRNNSTGVGQERSASLRVMSFASVPFSDDFESGSLSPVWQTTGTGMRRTQVTSNNGPHGGNFHVTMDTQEFIENYARNELTLGLDLGGYTNVVLSFWARAFGDEPDGPPPSPFYEGANFDGVAISVDGIQWYEARGLRDLTPKYQRLEVPLDTILSSAGLSYSPTFRIRFNQYDNLAIPYDGIGIDDVSVTGLASRRFVLQIPPQATEGDGVLKGRISVAVPVEKDVTVQLTSSVLTKVSVPASVTIRAGSAEADFDLTILDNALLDGTQTVTIAASASSFYGVPAEIAVQDNEKATLKLALFPWAAEGSRTVKQLGRVSVNRRVDRDIPVQLISSAPGIIAPPRFVVIPAGEKSAEFELKVVDGTTLDGLQRVSVTAHVPNWIDGFDTILVTDNDRPQLFVSLPARVSELDGTLTNAGLVRLGATVRSNLTVQLASGNTGKISVPSLVEIPANTLSVPFSLSILDNQIAQGAQTVVITASAAGFTNGSATTAIIDDETPPVPYMPTPADMATNVPVDTYLSWQAGIGEVIVNGGFETGDFTGWTKEDFDYGTFEINDGKFDPDGPENPTPPYDGKYNAMTAQMGGGLHLLYQDVLIPSDAQSATLSWVDRIRNYGSQFDPASQVFRVEVRDLANNVLATPFSTQPGDPLTNGWVRREYSISGYRGQWVRIAFFQEDHLGYFNVHVDDVSVRLGNETNLSFDVFFGTNSVPSQAEYVGSSPSPKWQLPPLGLNTTYFWRVVSKLGPTATPGPIWQFRTRGVGGLDHFEWSPIAAVQQLNVPFTATVTAKDDIGNKIAGYSGRLSLSGQYGNTNASAILVSEFDTATQDRIEFVNARSFPVNISGWQLALYDSRNRLTPVVRIIVPTNSIARPGDVFVLSREGSAPGVYPNFFMGTNVSWNNNPLGNPVAIAVLDNHSNVVDFVCAFDANPRIIQQPASIPAGEWIGNPLSANTNASKTFHRIGTSDTQSSADWIISNPSMGVASSNLALPFPPPDLLTIQPQSVVLSNGVWTGTLSVATAQSNIMVVAQDAQGHSSLSNPFRVEAPDDLSLDVEPPNLVVGWGQNFTSSWTIRNPGARSAENVRLTNVLPAALSMVSVAASQGSCTVDNGTLVCSLGSIPSGGSAAVSFVLNAAQTGFVTNSASLLSDVVETWTGNNQASQICFVSQPFLYSTNIIVNEGNAGTTPAAFEVRLTAPAPVPVSVHYSTLGFSATAGSDFVPVSGDLTFAPGITNLSVTVQVIGDKLFENLENFFLILTNPVNATLVTPSVRCRINNDDNAPILSIRDVTVMEGPPGTTTNAVFKVTLSAPCGLPVFVDYKVRDGSALLDFDYGLAFGTLVFNPGTTNLEIKVPVNGDTVPETNEFFYVYLNNLVNATFSKSSAMCTILDNGLAGLEHFQLSEVPAPQQAGQSFPLTIAAKDAWDRPFTSFSGSVALKAITSLQTSQVGTGKLATANPLGAAFHDSRTQVIYTTNDLPGAGQITALSLQVSNVPGQTLTHWTIRLKHTAMASYPSSGTWENEGWFTAYQRNQTIDAPGWVTFYFDTPFVYHGTNNLLVDFSFDNDSYSSDGICLSTASQTPRVLFARTDSGFGDPLAWSSLKGPQIRLTNQVPNARFVVETSVPVVPAVAGPFVDGVWSGSVMLPMPTTNVFLRALDIEGHAGLGNWFAVLGASIATSNPNRILAVQPLSNGTLISFTTEAGVRYIVERAGDLNSGQWTPVDAAVIGNGTPHQVVDGVAHPEKSSFYRVRVAP